MLISATLASVLMLPPQPTPSAERMLLREPVQLTSPETFVKAGEAYFNRNASWIIFQAVPVPEAGPDGEPDEPSPHYSMYVAKLERDSSGNPTGLGEPILVSPPGSANTCGWFHPMVPGMILFGSTLVPPVQEDAPGYSRENSKYTWQFPREMEVVSRLVPEIATGAGIKLSMEQERTGHRPEPIWERDGYDAEASWSPDGRSILYTAVDPETGDGDLWIYHISTGEHLPLVEAEGYDGGPFFSPDGKHITYRSDRAGNDLLQIYVAELSFDDAGLPNGIVREYQLTDNQHVNWCPFWHPSGTFLVYATSEVGHFNYEVFAVPFDPDHGDTLPETKRVTDAAGFDGLPVFSRDGSLMMWTAQRDESGTSQLVIARTTPAFARLFDAAPAAESSGAGSSGVD